MVRQAYHVHITGVENKIHEDPKSFWKFVNSKRSDNSHPSLFMYNNKEVTDPQDVVNAFGNHFKSVFGDAVSYPSSFSDVDSPHQKISLGGITAVDVEKALKHMKPKRAIGPDGIPQYIYKACSEFLIDPLMYVFNLVIKTSTIPNDWTVSSITPIPKEANTKDITNHRPITNMPVANKIFEKIVFLKIYPQIHS